MKVFRKVHTLQKELNKHKKAGKTIGFTPTMGALHSGHISLIKRAMKENDVSIVSIFVNPTQFNEKKDLTSYPRPLKQDKLLLENAGNQILFTPYVKEIYPSNLDLKVSIDFNGLDKEMEGKFRPGHFEGVAQVVHRLLYIVSPDKLYMGQKDFQQFTIIQHMIRETDLATELVVCPIEREDHGLARSSRNERLTAQNRKSASVIYSTLQWAKANYKSLKTDELCQIALDKISINKHFRPEYFMLVDGHTLKKVDDIRDHSYIVACTAVWAGEVRLIDNMVLRIADSG